MRGAVHRSRELTMCLAGGALCLALSVRAQSSLPVFVDGDRCTLRGPLVLYESGAAPRAVLPGGATVEVTKGDRRFTEVREVVSPPRDGGAYGLVDNRELAKVCVIERLRCLVSAPLDVTGTGHPRYEGKPMRVQKGGTVVVLARDRARSRVRLLIGELEAHAPQSSLVAACPSLQRAFAEEDAAKGEANEGPASRPAAEPR